MRASVRLADISAASLSADPGAAFDAPRVRPKSGRPTSDDYILITPKAKRDRLNEPIFQCPCPFRPWFALNATKIQLSVLVFHTE